MAGKHIPPQSVKRAWAVGKVLALRQTPKKPISTAHPSSTPRPLVPKQLAGALGHGESIYIMRAACPIFHWELDIVC
jgi:hypothetical protein